jgi:hypothetical protein
MENFTPFDWDPTQRKVHDITPIAGLVSHVNFVYVNKGYADLTQAFVCWAGTNYRMYYIWFPD